MIKEKEYVIIYQSKEHYEVLGYVHAASLEEAKKKALIKLLPEAKYYNVTEAEIDEIANFDKIFFKL
jgi:predicted transcriptional regulator